MNDFNVCDEVADFMRALRNGKIANADLAIEDRKWTPRNIYDLTDTEACQALSNEMRRHDGERLNAAFPMLLVAKWKETRNLLAYTLDNASGNVIVNVNIYRKIMERWRLAVHCARFPPWISSSGAMAIRGDVIWAEWFLQHYRFGIFLQNREVPVEYVMSKAHERESSLRVAKGETAIPPVKVISLSAVRKIAIKVGGEDHSGNGNGSAKSAHDRREHLRLWKGRYIKVRASKIHGGGALPRITKIVP